MIRLKNRKKLVAGAALFAVVVVGWVVWPAVPTYQGKSIDKWFYQAGDFNSLPEPDRDAEAFRAMGREAIPFLASRLEAAPSDQFKGLLARFSPRASTAYRQHKEMWQHRAAYLLGELGPDAAPAVTNLTVAAQSGNWALRGAATVALMKIRQEPIEPLVSRLKDTTDERVWYENAIMVGQFGRRAELAIPILLDALHHTNNIIQAHALIALGMIAQQPDKCVPAITPFLASSNVSDRQKALGALLAFRGDALPARQVIERAADDPDPWVRHLAELEVKMLDEQQVSKNSSHGVRLAK